MLNKLRTIFVATVLYIKQKIKSNFKPLPSNQNTFNFTPLSPIGNADIRAGYKPSFDWALKTAKENDIKNIALTGPYGSGKSTILKTYIEENKDSRLKFLSISLATFKVEKEKPENGNMTGGDDLLRLIELSILQQIFYHEKDTAIPDSRFKKIKRYTFTNLLLTTIGILLLMMAIFFLQFPDFFFRHLGLTMSKSLIHILNYFAIIVIFLFTGFIIFKSIRTLNALTIEKMNVHDAEIKINENISKSILNQHLDEILYFFEATDYNVVVIEDLDRFEETDIFTKLRELNLLINNSKKINKHVIFIYAVRDDMFKQDNERTKFFDFIIPVIPLINTSNSSQKLLEKINYLPSKISEDLIENISLFIDDMRLLHNIINEYQIYYQKLNKGLNQNNLIAILVYKNLYPNDFTKLANNNGELFKIINRKKEFVKNEKAIIETQISKIREKIKVIENEKIYDISELRLIYLARYVNRLSNFNSFLINGASKSIVELTANDLFELLRTDKVLYHMRDYHILERNTGIKFSDIEKEVSTNLTYKEREQSIIAAQKKEADAFKKEIEILEIKKNKVANKTIKELLSDNKLTVELENSKQRDLVDIMLRNGYIDEHYFDYISIFYEGSITKADQDFLINVKKQLNTEFSYSLTNLDQLIKKINIYDFEQPYILNIDLVDHLLNSSIHQNLFALIVSQLSNPSAHNIRFIDSYIENGLHVGQFVQKTTHAWPNLWSYLREKSFLSDEKLDNFFKLIIQNSFVEDIGIMYNEPSFRNRINADEAFLNLIPDEEKIKSILTKTKARLGTLNVYQNPSKLLDFVYENNFYEVNIDNLKGLMSFKGCFNELFFSTKNYSSLQIINLASMFQWVEENINQYIEQVFLKIHTNTKEDNVKVVLLLNKKELTNETKLQIIRQVDTKIRKIDLIDDLEIIRDIVIENKCTATWENVISIYKIEDLVISDMLVDFLNIAENAQVLSKNKISTENDEEIQIDEFISRLVQTPGFHDVNYSLLLKSIPYKFSNLDFKSVKPEKLDLLLQHKLLEMSQENLAAIKLHFPSRVPNYFESIQAELIVDLSLLSLTSDDISTLLSMNSFSVEEKNVVTESVNEKNILAAGAILKNLGDLIIQHPGFRVSETILNAILASDQLNTEQRLNILIIKYSQLGKEDVRHFFSILGEPYAEINIFGKMPLIPNTKTNLLLTGVIDTMDVISNYKIEEKGIRIYTYKKSDSGS